MIAASEAWVNTHEQNILPETFVEISYGAVDEEAQNAAEAAATNEAVFSRIDNVTTTTAAQRYATLVRNLWMLNGTRSVSRDRE